MSTKTKQPKETKEQLEEIFLKERTKAWKEMEKLSYESQRDFSLIADYLVNSFPNSDAEWPDCPEFILFRALMDFGHREFEKGKLRQKIEDLSKVINDGSV